MERLIFYWGACLMGLFCLISMLAVYNSNKRVLRDLKQPGEEKRQVADSFYAGTPETSERKYHYTQPFGLCGEENERTKDRTLEHPSDEEHILGNFRPLLFVCRAADLVRLAAPDRTDSGIFSGKRDHRF